MTNPTVREVFEKAYGAIPDNATCHIGYYDQSGEVVWGCAVIEYLMPNNGSQPRQLCYWDSADEEWVSAFDDNEDPIPAQNDLSKNPAYCYENFMDYRFDKAYEELVK